MDAPEVIQQRLEQCARAGKYCLLTLHTEPENWRQYMGVGGALKHLKPDLFVVTASGDYEDHYYVEIDMATEAPSVVLKKCGQYITYRDTGNAQREHGVFPFVVWLVPDIKRRDCLKRHIGDALGNHAGMFTVITMDEMEAQFTGNTAGLQCAKKP